MLRLLSAVRYHNSAGWSSLVARWAHNPKVVGSNPTPATNSFLSNAPDKHHNDRMRTARYVHWQEGEMWLGYFADYPDYLTQGESAPELEVNLRYLYRDLTSGEIPGIRKNAELSVG